MRLIVLVKESHCRSILRVLCIEDFQLKDHLKAGYDLPPHLLELPLINQLFGPVALLRLTEHDLRLFIELIHLPLLNHLDSLPRPDDSPVAAPTVLIVVDRVSLPHNAVDHVHGARVLGDIREKTREEQLGKLLA